MPDRECADATTAAILLHTNVTPLGVIPGRTLVNLNANWDNVAGLPIDAALFVTNLTKKKYVVNNGGGFVSAGFADVIVGEPRMWGFRLKYRFGE